MEGAADAGAGKAREIKPIEMLSSTGHLTPEQLQHYETEGYIMIRNLFSAEELETYNDRFNDIVEGRAAPEGRTLVMKDSMVAKGAVSTKEKQKQIAKLQNFMADKVFSNYIKHPKVLNVVEDLMGPGGINVIHSMLINKPPGLRDDSGQVVGGRHPIHQDLYYFDLRPADKIVGAWTAMQTVTRQNGCLVAIPGSHKGAWQEGGKLYDHSAPDWKYLNNSYFGVEDLPEDWRAKRVYFEMEIGDTVFFHPLLLHGSGRNRTDGYRRAISAHYASRTCETVPFSANTMNMWAQLASGYIRKFQRKGLGYVMGLLWGLPIGLAVGLSKKDAKMGGRVGVVTALALGLFLTKYNFGEGMVAHGLARLGQRFGFHRQHHMQVR
eukprot:Colp12_sorted_trinity150504_noHs@9032